MTRTRPKANSRLILRRIRLAARILLWVLGVPALLFLAVYVKLLFGPISVPYLRDQAQAAAMEALPPEYELSLGEAVLSVENGFWPVVAFDPVDLSNRQTGADISMDALEVGFSPARALVGRPGLTVTLVGPRIQLVSDAFGSRLTSFEVVEPEDGGEPTIRVREGETAPPTVRIGREGLEVDGAPADSAGRIRSENGQLINNLTRIEKALSAFETQAERGRFSRLRVRGGVVEIHDMLHRRFKRLTDVDFDLVPRVIGDTITGTFAADVGGRRMQGQVIRSYDDDGNVRLEGEVTNFDFSTLFSFLDDPEHLVAVRGAGTLGISVGFADDGRTVADGAFKVDPTGTRLRLRSDQFPITTAEPVNVDWDPDEALFRVRPVDFSIGQSTGTLSGDIVLGLDDTYGPTLSLSMRAEDVMLAPPDLDAPDAAFDEVSFSGWAAPMYGAIGIDQVVVEKPDVRVRAAGRANFLTSGLGIDVKVGGEGTTAGDLKRIWPYFIAQDARKWFVQNVHAGRVESASMEVDLPPGAIGMEEDEDAPLPDDSLSLDLIGSGVQFTPTEALGAISVDGEARVRLRDNQTTVTMDGATLETPEGPVAVDQGAFIIDTAAQDEVVYELSGDVRGDIPALLALARKQTDEPLDAAGLPVDPDALSGTVDGSVVATFVVGPDDDVRSLDYAANGTVGNFSSAKPIKGYTLDEGDLTFSVSQAGYSVNGAASIAGVEAQLNLSGKMDRSDPEILIASELDVAKLADLGFDAGDFIEGSVRFAARPLEDGAAQIDVDLTDATLIVADLGIRKQAGTEGRLSAVVRPDGEIYQVNDVSLTFGSVDIKGDMEVTADGLESAEFSTFKLSPGDNASLTVTSTETGVDLRLRGQQLDLKPMLRRFYALDQTSTGGPQSTQFDEALNLDIQLERAVGFYRTIAYNLDLNMNLAGEDLRGVSMQAQFAENNTISIATNPIEVGRTMTVAFNDLGTVLRFLNVYPRLAGGQGSLTLTHFDERNIERGRLNLREFSLVEEEKVVEILGSHRNSRSLVEGGNQLSFNAGRVDFIRRPDRIEVTEAVLDGDSTGGTMRGFIHTDERRYDLTGTYIPLFALNNIFQRVPILGQILGGREGEGLVGVTFAVRGSLDDPEILVNPASVLLPGVLRSIMEFRAEETPPQPQQQGNESG